MFFPTAASYWATHPISTCLRPRSAKLARSASTPCPSTSRFMKLNRQQTAIAECKAASSHPAARTASASACVMRVDVSVSFFTKARIGRSLLSMGAVARSWIRPSIVCGAIPNNSAAARWPPWQYWQELSDDTYAPISSLWAGVSGDGPRRIASETRTQCEEISGWAVKTCLVVASAGIEGKKGILHLVERRHGSFISGRLPMAHLATRNVPDLLELRARIADHLGNRAEAAKIGLYLLHGGLARIRCHIDQKTDLW